ncbi:hypothetical protein R3I94_021182 [Phoxinus phoxinus]
MGRAGWDEEKDTLLQPHAASVSVSGREIKISRGRAKHRGHADTYIGVFSTRQLILERFGCVLAICLLWNHSPLGGLPEKVDRLLKTKNEGS